MSKTILKLKETITSNVIRAFNCFPIKNNKVFLYSYYGSQYGCSPKYISEYLVENYSDKYDIVWAFNDINSRKNIKGIRKVKIMSLKYFYELCTSKIIITNFRTTEMFKKRKNQYYIQTWHSSLRLKQIEKDTEDTLPKHYVEMAKRDSKKLDLLISGCKFSTDIFKRAFWYEGEIFEYGTPRNDVLLRNIDELKIKVKDKLKIDRNKKVILYAPTFRKNNDLTVYNIDYSIIINKLSEKFGGEWIFLVKLHPHLISKSKELVYGESVLDVTSYDDIQELLGISDVLISDYSSLMFDFGLTKRPCFLYIPDVDEYTKSDRKLYFNINELPFIPVKNNDDFIKEIDNFDEVKYKEGLEKFFDKIGSFEKGECCKQLEKKINKVCFCRGEKMKKYKVGYTTGVFDMFHIGHLNILRRAKEQCKYLIVGVSTDELVREYKNKTPIVPFEERVEIVQSIDCVDKVVPQENRDKFLAWEKHSFDVMFVGDDWKGKPLFEKVEKQFKEVGVEVVYFPYTKDTSSTILREKLGVK